MNNCDNEQKIFEYIENELPEEDKIDLADHLQQCSYCQKLYDEYSAIKENTGIYYSSIDFNQAQAKKYKIERTGHIFRNASIGFSIAASFVLGFFLINKNYDPDSDSLNKTDTVYSIIDEPIAVVNQSEWNLKLNLLQHKIELLNDQMKQ
jgi:hypothetical protein